MEYFQHLVYISVVDQDTSESDLELIADISAKNNSKGGITGILLKQEGYFIQYIEGPPEAVDALMLKIAKDPRHTQISVITCGINRERLFPNWHMCSDQILLKKAILALHSKTNKDASQEMAIGILAGIIKNEDYLKSLEEKN